MLTVMKWELSDGMVYVVNDDGMFTVCHIVGDEYQVESTQAGMDACDAANAVFDHLETHGVYLVDEPTLPGSDETYVQSFIRFLTASGIDSATVERVEVTLSGE